MGIAIAAFIFDLVLFIMFVTMFVRQKKYYEDTLVELKNSKTSLATQEDYHKRQLESQIDALSAEVKALTQRLNGDEAPEKTE